MSENTPTDTSSLKIYDEGLNSSNASSQMEEVVSPVKAPFAGFGILCCILSGLIFAFNAMLVKLIHSIDAVQLSASRCYMQFIILLPYVFYNWKVKSIDVCGAPGNLKFLLLRGLTGSSAAVFLYLSLERIPLGDSVTLTFSNVIFAGCLAYVLLGESLTILDGVMSIIAMTGIVFIAQPAFIFGGLASENTAENFLGVTFALLCGVFAGFTFLIVRKLGKETPASLNVFYYSVMGAVSTTCIIIIRRSFALPCFHELSYLLLLGISGLGAQILIVIGLQYERAATCSVLRAFQIVFVFILQTTILNDAPSTLSLIGASLIFVSIFVIALRKFYNLLNRRKQTQN
ncbi:unnamed protein product [Clavelina lepadiformis]|uniref:EamA domain-containing protein n=1 Tax=Clavelina lepadiformis TaxID=159417 RepID=A0ABP0FBC6_CLALP